MNTNSIDRADSCQVFRIGFTIAVFSLPILTGCGDQSESSAVLAQKVYMHEDRGEYDEAIAAITRLIEREPENAILYYDRGVFHEAIDQTQQAIADYTEALKHSPGHADALNNRAAIRARQGELEQAIIDLDEAIQHNPENALAYRNRGEACLNLDQPDAALADLNRAATLDAGDPLVYFVRASLHREQGRLLDALEDAAIACHLDPTHEGAKLLRAEVYEKLAVVAPGAAPAAAADVAATGSDEEGAPGVELLESAPVP